MFKSEINGIVGPSFGSKKLAPIAKFDKCICYSRLHVSFTSTSTAVVSSAKNELLVTRFSWNNQGR